LTLNPAEDEPAGRLRVFDLERTGTSPNLAEEVRHGLASGGPKSLPPKYFYDELGSLLFEAICLLPEYYLTRAENEIFARHVGEIAAAAAGSRVTLLELGSGSATKTRLVIEALLERQSTLTYAPVDISRTALEASARALVEAYPPLSVAAYAGDYDSALARLGEAVEPGSRALVLFLGSNIGNFDREGARAFLAALRRSLRVGDALLLGADLRKERAVLEAAYNDALGITAAFNLNLLARLNRELGADFDLRSFRHVALYDETEGRVEMHLESLRPQRVGVAALGLAVEFGEGERVHTENSYKYDLAELAQLASETGFRLAETWLDDGRRFSSNLLTAA
jgi:dimethylhistidine N-methyltransferase